MELIIGCRNKKELRSTGRGGRCDRSTPPTLESRVR
jgi:hypothetical protein